VVVGAFVALLLGCEPLAEAEGLDEAPASPLPPCAANNDGIIDASEMPVALGVKARYRVGTAEAAVDLAGTPDEDAQWQWDFSLPDPQSHALIELQVTDPQDAWFGVHFPEATFAMAVDAAGALLSPAHVDDQGLFVHGLVSRQEDSPAGKTLVVYDENVRLYGWPLKLGDRRQVSVQATDALLAGIPTAFSDVYDIEVTGRGEVILPQLILENTLRVTVRLERTLLVGDARQVTHSFVHECLGQVVRATSEVKTLADTIPDDFSPTAEIWRLSL
jgi:hypothetical protein